MKKSTILILSLISCLPGFAQSSLKPDSAFVADIERVALADSTDPRVPLRVSLESGREISAAEFTIKYDPQNLRLLGLSPGGLIESFSVFETGTATPGRIDLLIADFSGRTIPAGRTENLFTLTFGVLPQAKAGEHGVLFTKAILADSLAERYYPVVRNGAVINPFSRVKENNYQYSGSDYAF